MVGGRMTALADASATPAPEDPPTPELLLPAGAPHDHRNRRAEPTASGEGVDTEQLLDEDDDVESRAAPQPLPAAHVTAVVVACDGARWLPRVLPMLAQQTRPPDVVVAADTGSTDASRRLLVDALGPDRVLDLPRGTAFGAAVTAALANRGSGAQPDGRVRGADRAADTVDTPAGVADGATSPPDDWVWLLHDDSAPAADALERLLAGAAADPSVAVAGPKVRGWRNRRLLLEVGVTVAGSGRRDTGLEHHEQDQGQHDGERRVLAVGTAGMLVRRAVLEELGGFDPLLPAFGDDVDLCWRARRAGHEVVCLTDAVVHHVAAAANGRRPVPAAGRHAQHPHLLERRSAMYVVAANRPAWQLPVVLVRLVLGALGRAVMYLIGKLPSYAADELRAAGWLLTHIGAVRAAHRERERTATRPHRDVAPLLARPGSQVRAGAETLAAALAQRVAASTGADTRPGRRGSLLETAPAAEESEDFEIGGSGVLRRQLRRPGVLLALGLVALGVVASRSLVGTDPLSGGALLPAYGSAADLWRQFLSSWRPVGTGGAESSPPYLAVVAALATPVGGSARLVVDLLLLG